MVFHSTFTAINALPLFMLLFWNGNFVISESESDFLAELTHNVWFQPVVFLKLERQYIDNEHIINRQYTMHKPYRNNIQDR